MSRLEWTEAECAVMRLEYPNNTAQAVADALGRSLKSVYMQAKALGLHKSAKFYACDASVRVQRGRSDPRMVATQYRAGMTPWNKGTHFAAGGRSVETRFKKGQMSGAAQHKYVPIGSTRVVHGNLERKVTDDSALYPARRWRPVHVLVWEAAHGTVPRGHLVVFRPGRHTTNVREITLDRLECITRAENMRRNSYHTRYPKDVARLIQLRGALNRKINNARATA